MRDKDILVIDDAADVRLLARRILEGDGARVTEAESIQQGLKLAATSRPHLIVLDLVLPEMTGFDFLAARRHVPSLTEVPIIILTGQNDRESATRAISLGVTDYLLKPFRATLLLQKVRKALRLTSFLVRNFGADKGVPALFTTAAEIVRINEAGCQVEAPVKLNPDEPVKLSGEPVEALGLSEVYTKVAPYRGLVPLRGRYVNEIRFAGMNEARAGIVRTRIKELK